MIAKGIPSYASEIISRPLRTGYENLTPFDLMRLTLETMERKGGIKRSKNETMSFYDETESVTVVSLIYTLQTGANMFQECLSLDSEDFDTMSWLLAAKMGCMLVASGIVIGNGPRNANAPDFNDNNLDFF